MASRPSIAHVVVTICWLIGIILVLVVANAIRDIFSTRNAPIYCIIPGNNPPPASMIAAGITNNPSIQVQYSQLKDKPVSENDIELIKAAIPWTQTTLHLYRISEIDILSSTDAEAMFWRGKRMLIMPFKKNNNVWSVDGIAGGIPEFDSPPGFWDKINSALPF